MAFRFSVWIVLVASIPFVSSSAAARATPPDELVRLVELLAAEDVDPAERAAAEERLEVVLAAWFDAREGRGGDRRESDAAEAGRDRVAALALHHLALKYERDPAWRAAWRERLVLATAWAHAAPDTFAEAMTLAYLASTALLEASDAGRAARVLDPFVDDPRLKRAAGETRLLERRACAARMTGDAARALELLERAKAVLADGEAEWMRYLLAEEFRVLMSIGLTDRAARVLDRQEALLEPGDVSTPAGKLARRVAVGNRIRWTYARSRHRQVIADADRLLATLPDDGEHRSVRALLSMYRALSLADVALATGAGAAEAALAIDALLDSRRLASIATSERHVTQRRVALALAASDLDTAQRLLGDPPPDEPGDAPGDASTLLDVRDGSLRSRLRRARGRSLGDDRECERFLDRFATFLRSWERTPIDEAGVGFLHYPYRREVVAEAIEAALWVEDGAPEEAFEGLVRVQGMGTLARRHGLAPPDLETVRERLLPPGTGLVALVPGPFGSHLFVVDGKNVVHARLPAEGEIAAAASDLRAHLVSPPERDRPAREGALEAAERLSKLLFPPEVAARLTGYETVLVTGFDLLGPVALEAIPLEGIGELGVARALAWLPSIPVGVWLAERDASTRTIRRRGEAALCLATEWDVERWPELGRLPVLPEDRASLAGAPSPSPSRLVIERIGEEATLAGVAGLSTLGLDRLVIVAHGVHDETRARPGCLLLADGLFGADEVERAFGGGGAPALVVVAACEVERAPLRRGDDGVQHLSGAWLSSGASTVLASDRPLDYHATVRLVGRALEGLDAGLAPAEALRRARSAVKRDPRTDHPFFYANLQLVGLPTARAARAGGKGAAEDGR